MEYANDNERDYYVYAWLRPCGTPFYIGKGSGRRDAAPKRNPLFVNVVSKIHREGDEPKVIRLHDGLLEKEALELERVEISKHGRRDLGTGTLTNMTDGGDGSKGLVPSAETRKKMSDAKRGKRASEEARANMRKASSNRSPECRAKMSLAQIGKPSDEHKAKNSASHKGKKHRPETLAKMRDAHRKRPPSSGFKGVYPKRHKWQARITIGEKLVTIGTFSTAELAAQAYDSAAYAAWGSNCYQNFPDATHTQEN